jgi:hypothetical protein
LTRSLPLSFGWVGVDENDDAIIFSLVEDIWRGEYALARTATLGFIDSDVHQFSTFNRK